MTVELCGRNRYETNIYVRPLIYKAAEDVGVRLAGVPDAFAIAALPFDKYFDAEAGLRACVSSWRRIDDTVAPARAKITGAYVNSALAKSEAQMNGFDEAILLSQDGHVAEGSAANLFAVKNGTVFTPDPSQNVLEGITRRTVSRDGEGGSVTSGRRARDGSKRALRRGRTLFDRNGGRHLVHQFGRSPTDRRRHDGTGRARTLEDLRGD